MTIPFRTDGPRTHRPPRLAMARSLVLFAILLGAIATLAASGARALEDPAKLMQFHNAPQPLPSFEFADGDGQTLSLAAFRGKVVLLNIWATWCVPCREEMPSLDRLQAALGGADFQVVPLSLDRKGVAVVMTFYAEIGLAHLPIYIDDTGRAAWDLRLFGIPTTLLLDRDGREVGRLVGPADWDSPGAKQMIQSFLERE